MRREGTKDRPETNHLFANIISNSMLLNMIPFEDTTNSTIYTNVGKGIINCDLFKWNRVKEAYFVVESGSVALGGLDVELFDKTNVTQIVVVSFADAEDDTIKFESIKSYLANISGRIVVEANFRKAGAIGPSSVSSGVIEIFGKWINLNPA